MRLSAASIFALVASQATATPVPASELAAIPATPAELKYVNFDDIPWANTTDEHVPLSKRTVGGIYICTDFNWGGTCGYKVQPLGVCIVLTSPWLNSISSIGPDPGTLVVAYLGQNCASGCSRTEGCGWSFTSPGSDNLGRDSPFNDRIGSLLALAT